ncbi:ABC transporter ATP-binding protein [Clostridium gasigenes]|uniref:ABC transporter ATP-binding protein n=1 Tax=Clostridium gasigenes TaxID=94869 RepID=A0A1H0MFR7_9CLOT|nr:ABC transporter ATP-binding protein [Clostridium gasigenes]MBB6713712.1 ABC transporter ATP-binding protein [Clostridium gasigenes]NKF08199.1 ABC transporter ATP-binding protein [Clostridium gasigenes]QSW18451.1 ABC transporter ATP-binding protein [Clostridium gasigenes]SDO79244.1 peptide/nickel transport system ATP-binding protein [Clostridium gasigenes]
MSDLIEFKNLKTYFYTEGGTVKAVNDVSFKIKKGEVVCVVGESGCGKSVTAMSLMRLVASPGEIVEGEILYENKNLLTLSDSEMRAIRGNDISMIFQEPMTSLNPVFTVGKQIMESIIVHQKLKKKEARKAAIDMISLVGIADAETIVDRYPHELSGGMKQRIMIAMALSCKPKVLIADEPTTALDVTIQAQILDLMRDIKEKFNTSIMFITHDLGVVAEMADYVVVMYAGKVIEEGPVNVIFKNPMHPYTIGLLKSKPILNKVQEKLYSIQGQVPSPINMPDNCYFNERCEFCFDKCKSSMPTLKLVEENHKVSCFKYKEGK